MNILTVVGARPQFVKAAAVSRSLRRLAGVNETLVHTGQHYDANMSDVFFDELDIRAPDRHLGIGSGPHGAQTGRMLQALEEAMLETRPDRVLVYGDTNSTLAAALAAAKLKIPLAHVEAGLRVWDMRIPEEVNRVLTDHVSEWLFTPTPTATSNLKREGLGSRHVLEFGDVMLDVALQFREVARSRSTILDRLSLKPKDYIVATVHRAENTDVPARLETIFRGLERISRDIEVVLPLHPRTRGCLALHGVQVDDTRFRLIEPVGYLDMVALVSNARLIATDSGGLQKEGYFFGTRAAILYEATAWPELVEIDWNRLVPPDDLERFVDGLRNSLSGAPAKGSDGLYGKGDAAELIAKVLAGEG